MPTTETLRKIDEYWSDSLGCPAEDLHSQLDLITVQRGDEDRVALFLKNDFCLVQSPQAMVEPLREALKGYKAKVVFDTDFQSRMLGDRVDRILGPAYLGYADESDFRPLMGGNRVRILEQSDEPALRRFAASVGELDWDHSGIEFDHYPIFGSFVEGDIVAATNYRLWGSNIAHIGVVTDRSHRSRGHGRAVVSAITDYVLEKNLIPQYRTLESNLPSIAIANALGFKQYAATIVVRLLLPLQPLT